MRNPIILVLALVVALPASAAVKTVTVSKAECRKIVRHSPSADVAYRPGVDVRGAHRQPADLGGGTTIAVPDEIEIPINVDLSETIGAAAGGLSDPRAKLGKVVYKKGRAWYNGKPLETGANDEVVAACRKRLKRRR